MDSCFLGQWQPSTVTHQNQISVAKSDASQYVCMSQKETVLQLVPSKCLTNQLGRSWKKRVPVSIAKNALKKSCTQYRYFWAPFKWSSDFKENSRQQNFRTKDMVSLEFMLTREPEIFMVHQLDLWASWHGKSISLRGTANLFGPVSH